MTDQGKVLWAMIIAGVVFSLICIICSMPGCQSGNIYPDIAPTPKQMLYKTVTKTNWLVTLSILGIGAGAFSFFNGSLKGIKFAAACLVVLGIVLMLTRYGSWVAFIALTASVGLPLLTVYLNRKALVQIVTGVQKIKSNNDIIGSDCAITKDEINKLLSDIQTPETQAIVKRIKDKI